MENFYRRRKELRGIDSLLLSKDNHIFPAAEKGFYNMQGKRGKK